MKQVKPVISLVRVLIVVNTKHVSVHVSNVNIKMCGIHIGYSFGDFFIIIKWRKYIISFSEMKLKLNLTSSDHFKQMFAEKWVLDSLK